jgi:hypothetical protein
VLSCREELFAAGWLNSLSSAPPSPTPPLGDRTQKTPGADPRLQAFLVQPKETQPSRGPWELIARLEKCGNERDEENHNENKEQDARNARGCGSYSAEPEDSRYQATIAKMSAHLSIFSRPMLDGRLSGSTDAPENAPLVKNDREEASQSRARPESRNYTEQCLAGERLADERHSSVLRRQLFASVAADKGERHPPRKERIGNLADRFSTKVGIEQSTIDVLTLKRSQRIAH